LRILDGIDPQIVDEIYEIASTVKDIVEVTEIRVRWLGHRLYAEVNIAVDSDLSVKEGHEIAVEVRHRLLHGLKYLSNVTIHVDPSGLSGETYH
jgi:divalent metal cation (Fe/Co/Zn/Cd) transporter